jgi:pyruvate dehydrogenase kinase 2/3/4
VIETLMQNPPKNLRHYPWRRSETNADFLSPESTAPMAGLGYGLPLSRNYARFFGGDLVIESMEGYGTDTYLYLPRLSKETKTIL